MGDRLATINRSKRRGLLCPFPVGGAGPIKHNVAWAEIYLCMKWHLDPSSHFATIDMGRKVWEFCAPF